jgi:hypothetical protein
VGAAAHLGGVRVSITELVDFVQNHQQRRRLHRLVARRPHIFHGGCRRLHHRELGGGGGHAPRGVHDRDGGVRVSQARRDVRHHAPLQPVPAPLDHARRVHEDRLHVRQHS